MLLLILESEVIKMPNIGVTNTVLVVGNIVTVVHPDWIFTDKQGVVVEIVENDGNKDGPIGVQFPTWYGRLFDYPDNPTTVIRFEAEDLQLNESFRKIPLDDFLKRLFGKMGVWSSWEPTLPLMPGDSDCMYEGCAKKAYFEAWVNVWGAARKFYFCGEHACYHGRCSDDFPPCKTANGKK